MITFEKNLKKLILSGLIIFIILITATFSLFEYIEQSFFYSKIFSHINYIYENNVKSQLDYNMTVIFNEIRVKKNNLENQTKSMIKSDVYKAYNIAVNLYNNFKDSIPEDKLQVLILNSLKSLKEADKYIFVSDLNGINQLNPAIPRGVYTYNFKDSKGKYIVRDMVKLVKTEREGFIEYYWYKPSNTNKHLRKVSFVKIFAPYNWYIGEGYYYIDMENKLKKDIIEFIKRLNSSKNTNFRYFVFDFSKNRFTSLVEANKISDSVILNKMSLLKNSCNVSFVKQGDKIIALYCYKKWNWVIGIDANLKDFYLKLKNERDSIETDFFKYAVIFVLFTVFISIVAIILSFILANKITLSFKKYKKEIEAKEKFQKKLIDTIPIPLFVKDTNGKFIDCNIEFQKFFGIKEEELLNMEEDEVPFELEILDKMIIADAYLNKVSDVSEVEIRNQQGELRNILMYKSVFRDLRDKIVGVIVVLFDVTERKKLEQKLKQLSFKDELTGTYNRRYFNDIIKTQMEVFKRHKTPFSLLMFDIDHFKRINDTFGHPVGDLILRELTYIILKHIRISDILSRVGGEEFIIISFNTTFEQAEKVANKLRKIVESTNFKEAGQVTISIGVTEARPDDTVESLVSRVDKALYLAKERGRNRVEVL